jgi:hypothetical protein
MPLRQALLEHIGGTITFEPQESGTITAAQADVFDSTGDQQITADVNVAITQASGPAPAQLAYSIPGNSVLVSELGENLRILFTYVVAGVTYRRNVTFDCTLALIYPTLTTPAQLAQYYPILEGRDFLGASKQANLIATAWQDLLNRIRGFGKNPNRIIDPAPLEPAHAALAASYVARNYRPGSSQSTDWQQWAAARSEDAQRLLREVMSNYPWYDLNEDLVPTIDEEHLGLQNIRLTR